MAVALAVLPASSVAVNVTKVAPTGKKVGASCVMSIESSTRSTTVAAARNAEIAVFVASIPSGMSPSSTRSAGGVSVGAVVSTTVTAKVDVAVLPASSVAEQVTVVLPNGNSEPAVGEQATVGESSTPSVAVGGSNSTSAPFGPVASAEKSAGVFCKTGGVKSTTPNSTSARS